MIKASVALTFSCKAVPKLWARWAEKYREGLDRKLYFKSSGTNELEEERKVEFSNERTAGESSSDKIDDDLLQYSEVPITSEETESKAKGSSYFQ